MSVLARVPITYEVSDSATTHAPMVMGSIGGIEGRFVLDTGSEFHLLNEELGDELGLSLIDLAAGELLLVEGTDGDVADFVRSRSATLKLLTLARDRAFLRFSMAAVPGLAAPSSPARPI